jgi:DNA-binding NtrC family response regulator
MKSVFPSEFLLLRNIKLLYVEDDDDLRNTVFVFLKDFFHTIHLASNGSDGLKKFIQHRPDIVITDLRMPYKDGIQLTKEIKAINRNIPVILNTAFAEIPDLISAIEAGVDRYLQKPVDEKNILNVLYDLSLPLMQQEQIRSLQEQNSQENWFFAKSPKMKEVFDKARSVAWTPFSVILRGETGSGKSYLARAIHDMSGRKNHPFVKLDLGTLPENLIESELFGHEKGAFTGADKKRYGAFESANNGTIFLDELENASAHLQSRLLRVVEEKTIVPVGSNTPTNIDVRIISASNKPLFELVKEGKFREDLYYRLAEFEIILPPLRERKEDVTWLASRFMIEAADELKKQVYNISKEAQEYLCDRPWYGNVRELRNFIRKAVLLSKGSAITLDDISGINQESSKHPGENMQNRNFMSLADNEREYIEKALLITDGNKTKAAMLLGIDITTLRRKLKKY